MAAARTPLGTDAASSLGARRLSLRVLPRGFYDRPTEIVARDLIGRVLECTRHRVIYGMYWCVNAITRAEGLPSAVLLRGVRPIEGLAAMRRRRPRVRSNDDLANGPGMLCIAVTGPQAPGDNRQPPNERGWEPPGPPPSVVC